MSKTLTASDRSALIRLASSLPKGDETRKAILAGLKAAKEVSLNEYKGKLDVAVFDSSSGRAFEKPKYVIETQLTPAQVKSWGAKAWKAWQKKDLKGFSDIGVKIDDKMKWEDFEDSGLLYVAFPSGSKSLDGKDHWSWSGSDWEHSR